MDAKLEEHLKAKFDREYNVLGNRNLQYWEDFWMPSSGRTI